MRYIYLLRHGNPGYPGDPRRCLGSTDVSISEYGKKQIEQSKEYIRSFGWKKVYTSPMKRCLQTGEYLGINRDEMVIKENLKEMEAGIWENLTFREIKEKYPELYEERGRNLGTFAVEGAESFRDAGERFAVCLDEIRRETAEDLLVIAHAGVIRGFLCLLTGCNPNQVMDFSVPYGSVTVLREQDGELELGDVGLCEAELLDEDEIRRIYKKCKTPEHVIAHMEKVAEAAMQIMEKLPKASAEMEGFTKADKNLVFKAALLHDICRTEKNHAEKSAAFLRKEGYKDVADLVAVHHSSVRNEEDNLKLDEILFYADKIVQGDRIVSVGERFAKSFEKCKGIPEAEEKHRRLYEKTMRIKVKIEEFFLK